MQTGKLGPVSEKQKEYLKEMLLESHQFLQEFNEMKNDEENYFKNEFFVVLSFKIHTFLNTIIGFAGLLYKGHAGPMLAEQVENIEYIIIDSNATLALMNDKFTHLTVDPVQVNLYLKKKYLIKILFKLRTSLNDIIGFSELMYNDKAGPISSTHESYLAEIVLSTKDISQLINQMQEYANNDEIILENKDLEALQFNLRTALNGIIGFSILIKHTKKEYEIHEAEYIDDILSSSKEMLQLVNVKSTPEWVEFSL